MNKIPFTKDFLESLKQEQLDLIIERKDAVFHLAKARAMGDLSENGYYKSSKSKLVSIDHRLFTLSNLLKYGFIIEFENRGVVTLGASVTIENNNEIQTYLIVGKYESDPKKGKISNESPLGYALMKKKVGDRIELESPSGKIIYKIIKIE